MNRQEKAFQLRIQLIEAIVKRTTPGFYIAPDGDVLPLCALCRNAFAVEDLEVDHAHGRTWYGRALNYLDRIRREWREFERGVWLRALCRSCNAKDGCRRRGRVRYLLPGGGIGQRARS